jgi:glyoxylase-like metal-dependent hydrolase (beta-lactamase superfamily II)
MEIGARGGLGGVALTHDHPDHADAIPDVRQRFPGAPVAAVRGAVDVRLGEVSAFGPLEVAPTPGHSPDHVAFVAGEVLLSGDAVLGKGSSLITPYPGALASYLAALAGLRRRRFAVLAPGHGPAVSDVAAKLEEYISHRLEREQRLLAALAAGARTVEDLLAEAWSDAPAVLRPAAAATLAAHLDKLAEEGRLPDGVERPRLDFDGLEGAERSSTGS